MSNTDHPLYALMASNGAAPFLALLEHHRDDYARAVSSRPNFVNGQVVSGGPEDRALTAGGLEFIMNLLGEAKNVLAEMQKS